MFGKQIINAVTNHFIEKNKITYLFSQHFATKNITFHV